MGIAVTEVSAEIGPSVYAGVEPWLSEGFSPTPEDLVNCGVGDFQLGCYGSVAEALGVESGEFHRVNGY